MAIGLVVFDEGNPRCAPHPTVAEQYQYEWAYANLDKDGNSYLDQTELNVLRTAVPEISD